MAKAPVVRLRDVTKSYGVGSGRTQVLRGVSFDVEEGELIALVGQSGSGKSTLLNVIGGLDQPDSGEVEVLGIDTIAAGDRKRALLRNESIGFV
ncbi:MAG TPA: ATP-binding cassette domain-containing protein, partial [Kofleriaceae bacterium]|nr:ATP-binding cassette domain-containing protein [Kofleriaceae bacterium]